MYSLDEGIQTRLTNLMPKDNPCKCGVLLPRSTKTCRHCAEKEELFQLKLRKRNPNYSRHALAEKRLHAKRMTRRKYIGRFSSTKEFLQQEDKMESG